MDRLSPGGVASRGRRPLIVVLVVIAGLIASSFLVDAGPADAATGSPTEATALYTLTNQSRGIYGLGALQWDEAAAGVARSWAMSLASTGVLAHNPDLVAQITSSVTSQWTRIGENVGYGPDSSTLEAAFMASPHHKDNILGDYNRVGVGAARDAGGRLWVSVEFIKGPDLAGAATTSDPFGSLDAVTVVGGSARVEGWAADPDTAAALEVDALVDGSLGGVGAADRNRPDVGAAYPQLGGNRGFSFTVPLSGGTHTICTYAINVGVGANVLLGCRSVTVAVNPFGSVDGYVVGPGYVSIQGWAADPETTGPVEIDSLVDGGFAGYQTADGYRSDVGAALPAYGPRHGYMFNAAMGGGSHTLCTYAINVGIGVNTLLACQQFDVPANPAGQLDALFVLNGVLHAQGWAFDPQTRSQIEVDLLVDGRLTGWGAADRSRPDVAAVYPLFGAQHGFDSVATVPPGTHQACAYAINVGAGANVLLGCKSVTL